MRRLDEIETALFCLLDLVKDEQMVADALGQLEQPPVSAVEVDRMALYLRHSRGYLEALERRDRRAATSHAIARNRIELETVMEA